MKLNEISKYKGKVINILYESQTFKDLLFDKQGVNVTKTEFSARVFPFDFVPGIITEVGTYVFFELDGYASGSSSTTKHRLRFYIITNKDILLMQGGTRVDFIMNEIYSLMANRQELGIGKPHQHNYGHAFPAESYYARYLDFILDDFK